MKNEKIFSRREFLKTGVGALAFLTELGFSKKALAELQKILEKRELMEKNFEEGIKDLQKQVWDKDTESFWVYVEKEDKRGWVDIARETMSSWGSVLAIDLYELFNDSAVTKTVFAHTHPAILYDQYPELPPSEKSKIKTERKSRYPLLPSGNDIAVLANQKSGGKNAGGDRLSHVVVEPSGVWKYDTDLNNPEIKKLVFKKTDEDEDAHVIPESVMAVDLLNYKLNAREIEIYRQGGINPENLRELTLWAETNYGIKFEYQPAE